MDGILQKAFFFKYKELLKNFHLLNSIESAFMPLGRLFREYDCSWFKWSIGNFCFRVLQKSNFSVKSSLPKYLTTMQYFPSNWRQIPILTIFTNSQEGSFTKYFTTRAIMILPSKLLPMGSNFYYCPGGIFYVKSHAPLTY